MACNSLSKNWPKGVRGCRGSLNDWNMDFFFKLYNRSEQARVMKKGNGIDCSRNTFMRAA